MSFFTMLFYWKVLSDIATDVVYKKGFWHLQNFLKVV